MNADRNLLFGVLALQADVIDQRQFAEICTAWIARKETALADLLLERDWITPTDRDDLERLLARKLRRHGGDVHASLAAAAPKEVRQSLAAIADPDIQQSLCALPEPGAEQAFVSTACFNLETRARYRLTRMHAQGGVGRVWLAFDEDLNRPVALKELRPELADSPAARERFLEEARITGQLEHPGMVPVHELARRPEDPPARPSTRVPFSASFSLSWPKKDAKGIYLVGKGHPSRCSSSRTQTNRIRFRGLPMSPLDYMNLYLNLPVILDNWEGEFANIDMYLNHGIQPRSGTAWKGGDRLISEMSRETKTVWSSPQFNIDGFPIRAINIRRPFMGKGSPQDLKDALWLAHRYGFIKNPEKPRAGALTLKQYCREYTGLDCNGFVGNYLAQHHNTPIETYGAVGNRLTSVEQIQSGTSLVWVPLQGGKYPHIAVVNSAQVVGDVLKWDLVQSSGSAIKGGPANGLRWGEWPKPVKEFKKDRKGNIYLPHGGVWLYPCNHALSATPIP